MLNNPRVQNKQQIGRLSECGQTIFDSEDPSLSTTSSMFLLKKCEREDSTSIIGSATVELEPVLDSIETGLEFLEEANELGSDGKHALDL